MQSYIVLGFMCWKVWTTFNNDI